MRVPCAFPSITSSSVAYRFESTYAWQLDTTVTAFRGSSSLLDVQSSQLTTGSLDDSDFVGGGVVTMPLSASILSINCNPTASQHIRNGYRKFEGLHIRGAATVGDSVVRHFGGVGWKSLGVLVPTFVVVAESL
jgi:hypothetical protein